MPNYRDPNRQRSQNDAAAWGLSSVEVQKAFDLQSIEQWRDLLQEENSDRDLYVMLLEKLAPVFEYISVHEDPRFMAARCWVLLYMVRPDLIEYETTTSAAKRLGVAPVRLREHIMKFRHKFPNVTWVTRPEDRRAKSSTELALATQRRGRILRGGGELHPDVAAYVQEREVA